MKQIELKDYIITQNLNIKNELLHLLNKFDQEINSFTLCKILKQYPTKKILQKRLNYLLKIKNKHNNIIEEINNLQDINYFLEAIYHIVLEIKIIRDKILSFINMIKIREPNTHLSIKEIKYSDLFLLQSRFYENLINLLYNECFDCFSQIKGFQEINKNKQNINTNINIGKLLIKIIQNFNNNTKMDQDDFYNLIQLQAYTFIIHNLHLFSCKKTILHHFLFKEKNKDALKLFINNLDLFNIKKIFTFKINKQIKIIKDKI